jgi:hypothetical protein
LVSHRTFAVNRPLDGGDQRASWENQEGFDMRIAGLMGLAAVMLAVIVTVAPKATMMTNEVSSEVYGISFLQTSEPMQSLAAR